ncbi:MAG: M56 family metallopeptidase [Eubacteriales bacterium]|nr:M56 family metallopeptidase [Eubacteriales bacterium]
MITVYVLLWSILIGSIFYLLLHAALKNTTFLSRYGVGFFLLCCVLCFIRLLIPMEFSSFRRKLEYPAFISSLLKEHYVGPGVFPLTTLIICFSLMISLLLIIRAHWKIHKISSSLKKSSVEDPDAQRILQEIDPSCQVPVCRNFAIKTPVIIGYLHPIIYLPDYQYTQEDLHNILLHEYTHYKRHHLKIKFFLHIFTLLIWWNPIAFLLERDISHLLELTCDETILRKYNQSGKLSYIGSLLHCLDQANPPKGTGAPSPYFIEFLPETHGKYTMQRFEYHLSQDFKMYHRKRNRLICTLIFLCILFSYCFIIEPYYIPEEEPTMSNAENSYLIELEDGSYEFHYAGAVVPVTSQEMKNGYYSIYPIYKNKKPSISH